MRKDPEVRVRRRKSHDYLTEGVMKANKLHLKDANGIQEEVPSAGLNLPYLSLSPGQR